MRDLYEFLKKEENIFGKVKESLSREQWVMVKDAVEDVVSNFKKITGVDGYKTIDPNGQFYQDIIDTTHPKVVDYIENKYPELFSDKRAFEDGFLYELDDKMMEMYAEEAVKKSGGKESVEEKKDDPRIPDKAIDFRYISGVHKFNDKTKEYELLNALEGDAWEAYVSAMAGSGTTVEYDNADDVFTVTNQVGEGKLSNPTDPEDKQVAAMSEAKSKEKKIADVKDEIEVLKGKLKDAKSRLDDEKDEKKAKKIKDEVVNYESLIEEFKEDLVELKKLKEAKVNEQEPPAPEGAPATAEPPKAEEPAPAPEPTAEPSAEEKPKEPPKPVKEYKKEYFGSKGSDKHFYFIHKLSDAGDVTDLQIVDIDDKVVLSAVEKQMDVKNERDFLKAAAQGVGVDMIAYDIVLEYKLLDTEEEAAPKAEEIIPPQVQPKEESAEKVGQKHLEQLESVQEGVEEANALDMDIRGKTVILSPKFYKGTEEDRTFKVEGGFGAVPYTRGNAVFGTFVKDGKRARVEGFEIEKLAESTLGEQKLKLLFEARKFATLADINNALQIALKRDVTLKSAQAELKKLENQIWELNKEYDVKIKAIEADQQKIVDAYGSEGRYSPKYLKLAGQKEAIKVENRKKIYGSGGYGGGIDGAKDKAKEKMYDTEDKIALQYAKDYVVDWGKTVFNLLGQTVDLDPTKVDKIVSSGGVELSAETKGTGTVITLKIEYSDMADEFRIKSVTVANPQLPKRDIEDVMLSDSEETKLTPEKLAGRITTDHSELMKKTKKEYSQARATDRETRKAEKMQKLQDLLAQAEKEGDKEEIEYIKRLMGSESVEEAPIREAGKHFKTKEEFIQFLKGTLIPDLRRSGTDETADDFEEAIYWMTLKESVVEEPVQEEKVEVKEAAVPEKGDNPQTKIPADGKVTPEKEPKKEEQPTTQEKPVIVGEPQNQIETLGDIDKQMDKMKGDKKEEVKEAIDERKSKDIIQMIADKVAKDAEPDKHTNFEEIANIIANYDQDVMDEVQARVKAKGIKIEERKEGK